MPTMQGYGYGAGHSQRKGEIEPPQPGITPFASPFFASMGDSQIAGSASGLDDAASGRNYGQLQSGWFGKLQADTDATIAIVHSYGVGGANTTDLAAQAVAKAAVAASRGAKQAVVVCGGNDGESTPLATTIANWTTIFDAYTAAGLRIITYVIPKNQNQPNHVLRRNWLSDPQRAIDWSGFLYLDVWDLFTNETGFFIRPEFSNDNTHLNAWGSYALGEALAEKLAPYLTDFVRNPLPTSAEAFDGLLITDTTGGTITNQGTAVVTGSLPAGLTATIPTGMNGLNVDFSTEVNSDGFAELVVQVSGRAGEALPVSTTGVQMLIAATAVSNTAAGTIPAGTDVRTVGKVKVGQDSKGLNSVSAYCRLAGNGQTARELHCGEGSGFSVNRSQNTLDACTVGRDHEIDLFSVPIVTGANWPTIGTRSVRREIRLWTNAAGEVDYTVRLSQFATMLMDHGEHELSFW